MVSSTPLGDIIQNREVTDRIAKWAIELRPHGLKYTPRTAIKSRALVDFINHWTELQAPEEMPDNTYPGSGAGWLRGRLRKEEAGMQMRLAMGDAVGWTDRLKTVGIGRR